MKLRERSKRGRKNKERLKTEQKKKKHPVKTPVFPKSQTQHCQQTSQQEDKQKKKISLSQKNTQRHTHTSNASLPVSLSRNLDVFLLVVLELEVFEVVEPLCLVVVLVHLEFDTVRFLWEKPVSHFLSPPLPMGKKLTGSSMYSVPKGTSREATSSLCRPKK
jgi:hypothetical protein